jgi:hypothetical protein
LLKFGAEYNQALHGFFSFENGALLRRALGSAAGRFQLPFALAVLLARHLKPASMWRTKARISRALGWRGGPNKGNWFIGM